MLRRKPDLAHRRCAATDPGHAEKAAALRLRYKRNGAANLSLFLDEHRSWRKVKVTEPRTPDDLAHGMRDLLDSIIPR